MRLSVVALLFYLGCLGLTYFGFTTVPTGFIPAQDMGYMFVSLKMPDAASIDRTEETVAKVAEMTRATPGVYSTFAISRLFRS